MKTYDIKGVVVASGKPTTSFQVTIQAHDQTSARRLVQMQYGMGGQVNIQSIRETTKK